MPRHTLTVTTFVFLFSLASHAAAQEKSDKSPGQSLFTGKDTTGWKLKNASAKKTWEVVPGAQLDPADPKRLIASKDGAGVLLNGGDGKGSDIYTEKEFGDCELHVEFMVPRSGNSGIYLMGRYEVQVLDSHGKPNDKLGQGDVGAIYSAAAPSTNAAKPAGEWQTFHIVFQAPRFDADGKKTSHAKFLSIKLNGTEVQKNIEVTKGPTGGHLRNDEKPTGPLLFQGDHGPVAFRNVRIVERQAQAAAN
jgi:hypothetical protein